jgi:hypothetical protein
MNLKCFLTFYELSYEEQGFDFETSGRLIVLSVSRSLEEMNDVNWHSLNLTYSKKSGLSCCDFSESVKMILDSLIEVNLNWIFQHDGVEELEEKCSSVSDWRTVMISNVISQDDGGQ